MSNNDQRGFVGWLREDRGPWRAVAQGDDYGATLAELLRVKVTASAVDRTVLATGKDPNREPR